MDGCPTRHALTRRGSHNQSQSKRVYLKLGEFHWLISAPIFKKKQLSVLHIGPDICCRNKSCFFQIPYFHIPQALHTWQQHTEPLLPQRMMALQFCRCRLFVAINYTPFSRRWSFGVHLQFWVQVFFFLPVAVSAEKNKDTAFPSHTSHVWMNMFWMKKLGFLPNPWAKDMTGNGWKLGWSHCLDSEAKML